MKEEAKIRKPTVYIASPYSKGDVAMNVHFQCQIFDELLTEGRVLPVVPLWTHFQHLIFPRNYEDWIEYDQALLRLYDCCLRLKADIPRLSYEKYDSSGADAEVETFEKMHRPVFYSKDDLYRWAETWEKG